MHLLLSIAVMIFIVVITDDYNIFVSIKELHLIAESLVMLVILWAGLYADKALKVARKELAWECDYIREATCCEKFR